MLDILRFEEIPVNNQGLAQRKQKDPKVILGIHQHIKKLEII